MPCMAARLVTLPNARPHSAAGVNSPIRPPAARTRIRRRARRPRTRRCCWPRPACRDRPSRRRGRMPGSSAGSRNDTIRPSCSPPRMAAWEARWVATGDPVDRTLRPRSTLRPESSRLTSLRGWKKFVPASVMAAPNHTSPSATARSSSGARPARAVPHVVPRCMLSAIATEPSPSATVATTAIRSSSERTPPPPRSSGTAAAARPAGPQLADDLDREPAVPVPSLGPRGERLRVRGCRAGGGPAGPGRRRRARGRGGSGPRRRHGPSASPRPPRAGAD